MQDFQGKYREEKRRYDNLLKMQQTILTDTDEYMGAFMLIKQALESEGLSRNSSSSSIPLSSPGEDISTEEALFLAQQVTAMLSQRQKDCEGHRWKQLYQQEAAESVQLSRQKQQLQQQLTDRQEQEQLDRTEVIKLLHDYLQLYNNELHSQTLPQKHDKKHRRSSSKTDRGREGKETREPKERQGRLSFEEQKENGHCKGVLQRLERDVTRLQEEVASLRLELMQQQQVVQLYQMKERKHLLAGGQFLNQ